MKFRDHDDDDDGGVAGMDGWMLHQRSFAEEHYIYITYVWH